MNIIVVDDEQVRHDLPEKYLAPHHTVLHAFEWDEALDLVMTSPQVGLILFDHDLADPGGRTGSQLAYEMIMSMDPEKLPARVIVVSSNPDGAKNIVAKWYSAGVHAEWRVFSEGMIAALATELEPQ